MAGIREEVVVAVKAEGVPGFKQTFDEARGSVKGLRDVLSNAQAHDNFLSQENLAKAQSGLGKIKETYTDLARIAVENGREVHRLTEQLAQLRGASRDTPEGVERSDIADALRTARRRQRSMGEKLRNLRGTIGDAEERLGHIQAAPGEDGGGGGDGGLLGGMVGGLGAGLLRRLAPAALAYWAYGKFQENADLAERFMGPGAQLGAQLFPRGEAGGGFRGVRDMFYSSYMGFTPTERMDMAMRLAGSGAYTGERGRGRIADLSDISAEAARAMGLTSQQATGLVGTVAGATQSDPRATQRILERIHETLKQGEFGTLKPQTVEALAGAIASARQRAGGGEFTGEQIENMVKFVGRFAASGTVIGREQGVNVMNQIGGTLDSAGRGSPLWFARLRAAGYQGEGLPGINQAERRWEEADTDTKVKMFSTFLRKAGYPQDQIEALLRENFGLTGQQQDALWAAEKLRGTETKIPGSMRADAWAGYGKDLSSRVNWAKAYREAAGAMAGETFLDWRTRLAEGINEFLGGAPVEAREMATPGVGDMMARRGISPKRRQPYVDIWNRLNEERASLEDQLHVEGGGLGNLTRFQELQAELERNRFAMERLTQSMQNIGVDVQVHPDQVDVTASHRSQRGGDLAPGHGGTK
ncbi:MAG: hypothetical protein HY816_19975 [Candidatus Wallbacteria bacterium]|nr:hypothetical protein [Candidatus Wallbacteria bacterium]